MLGKRPLEIARYARRNPYLLWGTGLLLALIVFTGVGALVVDPSRVDPLSVMPNQAPGGELPLGSDSAGRDLMAVLIVGTPLTLAIGLIAGALATVVAVVVAFVSAYYGGLLDAMATLVMDALLTVPVLVVLVVISSAVGETMTIYSLALIVSSLSWMGPARMMRSQVLSAKEQAYVQVAKLNGVGGLGIIFAEIMPNLVPYLAASFVSAVGAAILSAIGLEALGLGSHTAATLGMTIYYAILFGAMSLDMWWWWGPPIAMIVVIFASLFMISMGLDEVANPRGRRHA